MTSKITKIAAAALVAGVAGIAALGGTSVAAPKYRFLIACASGFTKSGPANQYTCSKTFYRVCKKGFVRSEPMIVKLGTNKYRVQYGCHAPAK